MMIFHQILDYKTYNLKDIYLLDKNHTPVSFVEGLDGIQRENFHLPYLLNSYLRVKDFSSLPKKKFQILNLEMAVSYFQKKLKFRVLSLAGCNTFQVMLFG